MSGARAPEKSCVQDDREMKEPEEMHIFEIANMEFELDDKPTTKRPPMVLRLAQFVTDEDSIDVETQTAVDEVSSSPEVSDSEGLEEALMDMVKEFQLDLCHVTQALLKNNGEVGSTRHFLRTGQRPDGYPIWERRDDWDLQKNDPKLLTQLSKKYGEDNVAKRLAFLAS
ncbi:telomeric repeat-binding factor 2-interacting protein 1 [Mixophyes fleayi]|uniref:telomeric repeat-binding factor 2-interacting protein 1 n=1 Tax=Mixophyes fleayi TaxID=3061075 RepID=UPI003F4E32AC